MWIATIGHGNGAVQVPMSEPVVARVMGFDCTGVRSGAEKVSV